MLPSDIIFKLEVSFVKENDIISTFAKGFHILVFLSVFVSGWSVIVLYFVRDAVDTKLGLYFYPKTYVFQATC